MTKITISIDDETHRRARLKANELGLSLSALVRHCFAALAAGEGASDLLKRLEQEKRARIVGAGSMNRAARD